MGLRAEDDIDSSEPQQKALVESLRQQDWGATQLGALVPVEDPQPWPVTAAEWEALVRNGFQVRVTSARLM